MFRALQYDTAAQRGNCVTDCSRFYRCANCMYLQAHRAFLSRIGIEDVRRRNVGGIDRRIVPVVVGWPCPKGSPRGPAENPSPSPTESHAPAATTPSESPAPVPSGPSPAPTAMPASVPSAPVITVPGQIAGDHTGTVKRRGSGTASNLGAWCSEGMPLSVGHGRTIWHAGRSCCHRGGAGAGHATPRAFATYSPGVAGCELMPSGRCVAGGGTTFPRPGTSGSCTAWTDGTNARPRRRSPTAIRGSAAMIAASLDAAIGTAAAVETSTGASVRASSAASVTTAMLGKGGCGKEYESKGRGS